MFHTARSSRSSRAPALMAYCDQMRHRVLARARLMAEATARQEAERMAEIKSGFISMMSHELRTPLNSIIGFSEILSQPGDVLDDAERRNYAQLINSSGKHLTSVVNGILEMSKIQSGTYTVDLAPTNIIDLLEEIVAMLEIAANAANVNLVRAWEPREVLALVDETRFQQSVRNVVDNAIKFTGEHGTVSVDCRQDGQGHAVVTVADTGTGMDEEELARAMTPFGQAGQGLSQENGGTGLGLCIARDLTKLQGGQFAIRSRKGEGTLVTFTIPDVARGQEAEPSPFDADVTEFGNTALREAVSVYVGH